MRAIIYLFLSLSLLPFQANAAREVQSNNIEKELIQDHQQAAIGNGVDCNRSRQINFTEDDLSWIEQHPQINFTGDPNWLPFEAFTKEGKYIGIIAGLIDIIEKRSSLKINKIPTKTWEESIGHLKSGKVNMLTETTDSPLGSEFLFTQAILPNPIVVMMQEGNPYVHSLRQLSTKKIAIIKEYGYIFKIKEKYPDYDFHEVDNIQEGLYGVAEGKYDAMLTTMALGSYTMKNMQLSNIQVVGKTEFNTQIGFAISREYAPLVGILNKIINSIDEQTKQNIMDKWVTQEYIEKIDYTLIYRIAFIAFLIISGTLFWSWRLKKEIHRRTILENKLARVNKQITDSIEFAAIIQQAFIPEERELSLFFEDYFTIWEPRDIVGGDIYFFDRLNDRDQALLILIDCTGHGVPGAFVTMLVKTLARNLLSFINKEDEEVDPAKLLTIINRSLKHLLKQHNKNSLSNAGLDGAIVHIDRRECRVIYAGANIPLFYKRDTTITMIKADRHSLGYKTSNTDFMFSNHQLSFDQTVQFYLTTDGYIDQNGGENGFPMGRKPFRRVLETHTEASMQEQKSLLEEALMVYQGDEDRNDDITVIGFRCKGVNE
ncbi:MAG: transporter substrate-binding domain-containing protein [Campylobacterota bacterium]|nr:transporter substrate-binding domain-containing protein [Campylobacterota bacterium]